MAYPEAISTIGRRMNVRRLIAQRARLRSLGYGALRLRARLAGCKDAPPILVNSIPKSGTHVVLSALDRLPRIRSAGVLVTNKDMLAAPGTREDGRPRSRLSERQQRWLLSVPGGHYAVSHLWGRKEFIELIRAHGFRLVFVIRDPRDALIAHVHYTLRMKRGIHHRQFRAIPTEQERYRAAITGFPSDERGPALLPLDVRLRGYAPWLHLEDCLTIRFEEMVGERGGGSNARQRAALAELCDHLAVELPDADLRKVAAATWSPKSATFRRGRAGGWRSELDADTLAVFRETVPAELMATYGYGD